MKCPVCEAKTAVVDKREKGDQIFRRRECKDCGYRFKTYEFESGYMSELFNEFLAEKFPDLKDLGRPRKGAYYEE
ncbi:hypothetical protein PU629_07145 [Pullulanibacillus sp. KACC 23026]|uniref:NrdR family transcriptional regulator n=1 Tax=Pullulanibacillus sp. KACC 23026 TaxID=3028315 RepID=UPI0023AF15B3|nr:hypothetical protein [Pullulanibacillus sp. KACC 23026]WEG14134.1 hypothetical protein PU629_07145 [Pullulanibacillus sp. KACC 23026]